MLKARWSKLTIAVFLLVGLILSGIVSVMYLTRSINFQKFYDVGNLYDIISDEYKTAGENWQYNFDTKLTEITAENARHFFDVKSRRKRWNYLYLEIEDLSREVWCEIEFSDKHGNISYVLNHRLQEGCNVIPLNGEPFHRFCFVVREPCSFHIQGFQLRERVRTFGWEKGLTVFGVVYSAYLLLLLIYILINPNKSKKSVQKGTAIWLGKVQEFYDCLASRVVARRGNLPAGAVLQMRRVLFLICQMILYFMLVFGLKWKVLPQRKLVFLLGLCLLLIAFLSAEVHARAVNWNHPLMYAWIALWGMSIVSEFVVGKMIQFVGVFMLVCMGFLYMAWGSMKKPDMLLKDFLVSIRWSYWMSCLFSLFFRPYVPGLRYIGIYTNPNTLAGYLVTANIAFLIWLDDNLNKEKLKLWDLFKNMLGLVSLCGFLIMTQSITSAVVYLVEWIIFIWKQFPNEKRAAYQVNIRKVAISSLVAVVLTVVPGKWCLINVPNIFNTSVSFRGDAYLTQTHPLSLVANAAEDGLADRVMEKMQRGDLDNLLSSRTEVWRTYIRQLNLFGHRGYLRCFGNIKMHAHNAFLQIMHYYGVFAAVPYLLMLYYSVKYGILAIFDRKRSGASLFFLMAAVHYIVRGFAEDMATPYLYIGWLAYFMAVGGLANQPEEGIVKR